MDQVLHMNKGEGKYSYAMNSNVQNGIISSAKLVIEKALIDYFASAGDDESTICFGIADLGCAFGPNTWKVVSHIIDTVVYAGACNLSGNHHATGRELVVYLNDLPGNDFNELFVSLPNFNNKLLGDKGEWFSHCFVGAIPGSFYGRLFPSNSLHFVHSSSSLHWLSKVPLILEATKSPRLNKGKIYLSKSSNEHVVNAYSSQFREDFHCFLRSRSIEVVPRGCMVLTLAGRRSADPTVDEDSYLQWDLLADSVMTLVSEDVVEQDKVDSFNVPYYATSPEELRQIVEKEGSFEILQLQLFQVDWDGGSDENSGSHTTTSIVLSRGQKIATIHRAVVEGMFEHHFGRDIMDRLFSRYAQMLDCCISRRELKFTSLTVSMKRKCN